jgi:preprotein translocase subunit SecE
MTTRANKVVTKSAPEKKSRFHFLVEVVAELRKAHWPTRQEALRLSILVLAVCVVVGLILGVLDLGFTRLFLLLGG